MSMRNLGSRDKEVCLLERLNVACFVPCPRTTVAHGSLDDPNDRSCHG